MAAVMMTTRSMVAEVEVDTTERKTRTKQEAECLVPRHV